MSRNGAGIEEMNGRMDGAGVLPFVWATGRVAVVHRKSIPASLAFYRTYTEGMLGRYMRLSMESGRVCSLLGQEMFRGNVTSCRVNGFDDVVIFVYDIERCMAKLEEGERRLIARLALQRHTHEETARLMGLSLSTVLRRYEQAIDCLTRIFLEAKLLEPLVFCQGEEEE